MSWSSSQGHVRIGSASGDVHAEAPRTGRRKRSAAPASVLWIALLLAGCAALGPLSLSARDSAAADGEAVCNAYWDQKYDEAVRLAKGVVGSEKASSGEKIEAYKCQACAHVARRQVQPARVSIAGMLQLDPTARFTPDYDYPPPVIDLYNAVRDSLFPGTMDIRTVAVGDFENNSIYQGKFKNYDYSLFGKALVHTIMADLAEATPLKVVDRQRTGDILKEIELGQSGFVSAKDAVRFGQMLGAQSFIFGQYMILSKDEVRIDARVVHTATGEVVLARQVTGNFGGDPKKFLELERKLVEALAEGISQVMAGGDASMPLGEMSAQYFDQQEKGIKSRTAYVENKFRVAEALELEDKGKYAEAQEIWKQVIESDPENDVAKQRVRALEQLAQS